jgi:hypothetical protein
LWHWAHLFIKLLLIAAGCRALNIRLSAALLLRNVAKLKNELTVLFLDDDLHFLENHLTAV